MSQPSSFTCTYSPGIPQLLQQLNISLVITPYHAGKLVFISAADDKLIQLAKTINKPMGLAIDEHRLAVAANAHVFIYSAAPQLAKHYARKPATYDTLFVPRAQYFTSYLDIHDLVWIKLRLLMVNTRFSCLAWLNEAFNFVPFWKPHFISRLMPEDRCHLNGVAVENAEPKYVTMLGATDEAAGWRKNKTAGGVVMDVKLNEIILQGLPMPHTPRIINGELYLLLSATGEVVKANIQTGTYDTVCRLNGYVRGMSFCNGYLFVAYSRIRASHQLFSDLPVASVATKAGIAVIHLQTGAVTGEIIYQDTVEEIYDLQVIAAARPGLVNFDQPEKDLAISLPGDGFWAKLEK